LASPRRPGEASNWRQLAGLGDELLGESSLLAQRDRIAAAASRLLDARADVWLDEDLFRLPDWDSKRTFAPRPPLSGMRRAIRRGDVVHGRLDGQSPQKGFFAAIALQDKGFVFGALQVTRRRGPRFSSQELERLSGLERIVSVGLYGSHRGEVERFRLRQISLLREVSAEIAKSADFEELARRVTASIQDLFKYYYVAIFTLPPGDQQLRFHSSAGAVQRGKRIDPLSIRVRLGEGLIGAAAASGEEIVCDDVEADPRYRLIDGLPGTRSELVIPLKVENRVLGVLDVQSNQLRGFHPNDRLILRALADNVARAIEGRQLYRDLKRRADQLALVAEVSRRVTSTLDLSLMMRETADLIHERFGYSHVALFTVHPRRRVIQFEAGSGKRAPRHAGLTIPLDDPMGIIPWVARNGETVLAADVTQDPRYTPSPLPPRNTRSELAVPLKFGEQMVGLLDIQANRVNAFSDDDRLMFEAVAGTLAAAIRNADLYHSEQWRRQVADSLREVAGLLSSQAGVEEVLEAVLLQLERNLPVDVAAIWLLSEDRLLLSALHGEDALLVERARREHPDAEAALLKALESELPTIRMPGEPILPDGRARGYDDNSSSLIVPLRLAGQPLGLLTLSHHSSGRYGHEAQAMTTTFANYASVAIENARLFDAAQVQAYASAALLQVAQAVVSPGELDEILSSIIRTVPILVGVRQVVLYLWAPERQVFVAAHQFGLSDAEAAATTGATYAPGTFPLIDAAQAAGGLVTAPVKGRGGQRAWLRAAPTTVVGATVAPGAIMAPSRLAIAVPMMIKNDLYGVMVLEEREGGQRFRGRRLEIIQGIAQQIALAIQHDRLQTEMVARERLETEVHLARQIQKTFLPDVLPETPGWQVGARWRTAREVGGDLYDVIQRGPGQIVLFVGDVADKGVPAALFMAVSRTLVRAAALETDSPAAALNRVNELLYPDTAQGMYVTGVFGTLDLERGTFTYANAGHNPPVLLRADGSTKRLRRTGVALGTVERATFDERAIEMHPGDCLLMFTDGVTESISESGEFFGDERLMQVAKSTAFGSAEELLNAIEARVDEFTQPLPAADDLTLLAVRRERKA